MSPEEIARRFERRPGYELIDYAPVALPLLRLTVDAVTMVHKEIPPIKEFVMRSLSAGFSRAPDVEHFLGLDTSIVDATFHQLRSDHYVTDGEGGETVVLTQRGRDILQKARESSPEDEMLVFLYDRLLQKPVRLSAEQLLVPSNIDVQNTIEIRPYPAEGPDVRDLSIPDILHILEEHAGGREVFARDLLRIKRIVRRVRLFRPGVALVFKKTRSPDVQIEFVVDEARHEALSHIFAERGGPRKMGFVKSIEESSTATELRRYMGSDVVKLLPDQSELDARRLAVSIARIKHQAAIIRAERIAAADPSLSASSEVEATARMLEQVEGDLRSFAARPVAPFEIPELFELALEQTQSLLMISSRGLHSSFVNSLFLKNLQRLLSEGARVVISVADLVGTESAAVELERLRTKYPKLELQSRRRGHFYHLLCDTSFALVCNRPFLSNDGKVRSFHHTVGYLLQRSELVQAFRSRIEPDSHCVRTPG